MTAALDSIICASEWDFFFFLFWRVCVFYFFVHLSDELSETMTVILTAIILHVDLSSQVANCDPVHISKISSCNIFTMTPVIPALSLFEIHLCCITIG